MGWWRDTPMEAMTSAQWEALCDGCAKCCVIRLEDEDTGDIHATNIGCKLLDGQTCRCTDYPGRQAKVPDCVQLTPDNVRELSWLPKTCGYRLIAEGRPLFNWHPLVSGDPESVHQAGMSIRGSTTPEHRIKVRNWIRRIVVQPGEG
jgi:uncharacterized protein